MNTLGKKAAAASAAALITAGLTACSSDDGDTPAPATPTASASASAPAASSEARDRDYRDGTYSADGVYGNNSRITVSLTLSDGVVGDLSVTPHATNPTSRDYQQDFADAAPAAVNGKPIDEVELDLLAGASGTTEGFNSAIDLIQDQAAR
ncbi:MULTISPECIES: hypothetical protein [unclassified Streptomyces]|uniref:hypothetical protein n=1 Tax=unclassified Streptomyces TaxID=2593676 RepID=UPI001655C824|nr:hypothetical protein [Streptomyces sp. CB02980]MCB8902062.1 hypothetical protein [Streptomyces sp. CB02980]